MHPHFKLLPRVFMNKVRTVNSIFMNLGWQGNRPNHFCPVSQSRIYNLFYRIINYLRVIGPNFNSELRFNFFFCLTRCQRTNYTIHKTLNTTQSALCSATCCMRRVSHHFNILVTTPAPTVFPPSLIAKRCFSSKATGTINFTINLIVSPGITISVP